MSIEARIRELTEKIIACQDDGQTALLAEELQDTIRLRLFHLRAKLGFVPLGRYDAPS